MMNSSYIELRVTMGNQPDRDELEANYFAMCLLIPEEFILADLASVEFVPPFDFEDDPRIKLLAQRYKVSEQLMLFRLIDLGKMRI
jgi:Zn-dependent peptidase ImmA (M78 family)